MVRCLQCGECCHQKVCALIELSLSYSTLACADRYFPSECAGVVDVGARRSAHDMIMPDVFVSGCIGVSQGGATLQPGSAKVVREVASNPNCC